MTNDRDFADSPILLEDAIAEALDEHLMLCDTRDTITPLMIEGLCCPN